MYSCFFVCVCVCASANSYRHLTFLVPRQGCYGMGRDWPGTRHSVPSRMLNMERVRPPCTGIIESMQAVLHWLALYICMSRGYKHIKEIFGIILLTNKALTISNVVKISDSWNLDCNDYYSYCFHLLQSCQCGRVLVQGTKATVFSGLQYAIVVGPQCSMPNQLWLIETCIPYG